MNKKEALKAVQNDKATFISERHTGKDGWEQIYHYNGHKITVCAIGDDRWILEDEDFITIEHTTTLYNEDK